MARTARVRRSVCRSFLDNLRDRVWLCSLLNGTSSEGILGSDLHQTLRLGPAKSRRGCVMDRRHFNLTQSLEERLAEEAKRLRAEAKLLPPGATRDEIIRRARQAETGSRMSDWLRSPGLRRPE